jgi:hypothetical protein
MAMQKIQFLTKDGHPTLKLVRIALDHNLKIPSQEKVCISDQKMRIVEIVIVYS